MFTHIFFHLLFSFLSCFPSSHPYCLDHSFPTLHCGCALTSCSGRGQLHGKGNILTISYRANQGQSKPNVCFMTLYWPSSNTHLIKGKLVSCQPTSRKEWKILMLWQILSFTVFLKIRLEAGYQFLVWTICMQLARNWRELPWDTWNLIQWS